MKTMNEKEKLIEVIVGWCAQSLFPEKTGASVFHLPELSAKEWEMLMSMASTHGVIPIIMQAIKDLRIENKDLRRILLKKFAVAQKHKTRYELRLQVISELAEMFSEEGLDMMVFKGAALAQLYPIQEWRVFSDIDFYLYGKWKKGVEVMERHGIKTVYIIITTPKRR